MNPLLFPELSSDVEGHVYQDRLYLFGSRDAVEGSKFCQEDYHFASAALDDLEHFSSILSYQKKDDPSNKEELLSLWAPDVVKIDEDYLLFYCLANYPRLGVAKSKKPQGPYTFIGYVRHQDGSYYGKGYDELPFDPALLYEHGRLHLYSGQGIRDSEIESHGGKNKGPLKHYLLSKDGLTILEEAKEVLMDKISART